MLESRVIKLDTTLKKEQHLLCGPVDDKLITLPYFIDTVLFTDTT